MKHKIICSACNGALTVVKQDTVGNYIVQPCKACLAIEKTLGYDNGLIIGYGNGLDDAENLNGNDYEQGCHDGYREAQDEEMWKEK